MLLFHHEGDDETKCHLAYGGGKSQKYYRVPEADGKERIRKHPPEIGKSGKGKFGGSSACKVQIGERITKSHNNRPDEKKEQQAHCGH
jgi:hypothetical protein